MKEKSPKFEIIIDGEVVKIIKGWTKLDNLQAKFDEKVYDSGFREEHSSSSGSHGFILYFNQESLESRIFAWREITEFVDKMGKTIYYGDYLKHTQSGTIFSFGDYSEFDNKTGYYIRPIETSCWNKTQTPITAEEIKKEFVVIHNVFPCIENKLKQ